MKKPPQDMLDAATAVLKRAHAPYSHFPVGACVRAENGTLFVGCNVENAAFPIGICAEGGAISALVANGQKQITEALIVVPDEKLCPPCGACRQRLLEFAIIDFPVHVCTTHGHYEQFTIQQLLPMAFGPIHLET